MSFLRKNRICSDDEQGVAVKDFIKFFILSIAFEVICTIEGPTTHAVETT